MSRQRLLYILNQLEAESKVSTLFRDPQARSSVLAALGTLQPRAFGSLNRVETLDSASNYYLMSFTTQIRANM